MKTNHPLTAALCALLFILALPQIHAASSTWSASPGSGDWNTSANWLPMTVPNGSADTASFDSSTVTGVSISANSLTQVSGIVFNLTAEPFTITASRARLTLSGTGITNNSGITQTFVTAVDGAGNSGFIDFTNSATAGSATVFINQGGTVSGHGGGETTFHDGSTAGNATFIINSGAVSGAFGGFISFFDNSTAGSGIFTSNGSAVSSVGEGEMSFFDNSTAGNGTFTNNGSTVSGAIGGFTGFVGDNSTAGSGTFTNNGGTVSGAVGGITNIGGNSSAGNGTFTNNGGTVSGAVGGVTDIGDNFVIAGITTIATAGNATLIANAGTGGGGGGSIVFYSTSMGGTATVKIFGNGSLDISPRHAPGVTVGSIEGSGVVFLGERNLTVGSNNLNKTFSGVIQDSGSFGGTAGSLTKTGTGMLTLSGVNTYIGGTTINGGTLVAASDGALGGGNVSLTTFSVALTLQNGATNNYIADTASLSIVSSSTVNLSFTGSPDTIRSLIVNGVAQAPGLYGSAASGAPNQLPELTGTGKLLVGPGQLLNIATRLRVQTGDNVLIGGFIITGTDPKKVIILGIGPSLAQFFSGSLSNPTMELHQGDTLLQTNDDWKTDQQAEIEATGLAPTNDLESAIVRTLDPGSYTAILRGKGDATGIGVVQAYDLNQAANSKFGNIATRGFVDSGDNVMIGGFIIGPANGVATTVVVRAIGPSLTNFGVSGALQDPTLELHDGNGATISFNDNWKDDTNQDAIPQSLKPSDQRESALFRVLAPGSYTAIVRGSGDSTGVGLVEVYNAQ